MEIYLVGGAVRDALLGLPVHERDWVVVGATRDLLLEKGFRPVGKDFPVFLHPETQEEYALARTERKTGPGYHGFAVEASVDVTLEEDLRRRDLTINAIAQNKTGALIDPFGGQRDLQLRLLRHISEAFIEDPVRVLRLARFSARFAQQGFHIAEETLLLVRRMGAMGELEALVPERVFQELKRALLEATPTAFFECLKATDTFRILFPEMTGLLEINAESKSEEDAETRWQHAMSALKAAASLSDSAEVRFATMFHAMGVGPAKGKNNTTPSSDNAEVLRILDRLSDRLRVPLAFRRLACQILAYEKCINSATTLSAEALMSLLEKLDAFRQPAGLGPILLASQAIAQADGATVNALYLPAKRLTQAALLAANEASAPLIAKGLKGMELGVALREARIKTLADWLKSHPVSSDLRPPCT